MAVTLVHRFVLQTIQGSEFAPFRARLPVSSLQAETHRRAHFAWIVLRHVDDDAVFPTAVKLEGVRFGKGNGLLLLDGIRLQASPLL